MHIALNAGHTLRGAGSGAVGYIYESTEARKVVAYVARYLRIKGHKVSIINIDKASTQSEYLRAVASGENKVEADLFVSIHFNAGGGTGSECFTYKGKPLPYAVGICEELSKLGFKNRGVKDGSTLYVIRKTKAPAVLVEVCFVDSKADTALYLSKGAAVIGQAITRGIVNY